eukprot:2055028-Alexandrium_andersonii.AAC.1
MQRPPRGRARRLNCPPKGCQTCTCNASCRWGLYAPTRPSNTKTPSAAPKHTLHTPEPLICGGG